MSPRHKVNETFNFWHDVKANLVTRSNWEDKNNANPIVPAVGDANNRRGLDSSATRQLMRDKIEPSTDAKKERDFKQKKKALMEQK
jgi:hypothetical protein